MSKIPQPFLVIRRTDSKTFRLTLSHTCGLPRRVCAEWQRRSFHDLPDTLANYRNPKTKAAADAGALALIAYLKARHEEGSARRVALEDVTVGKWIERFTSIETSPRTGINASKNRPYSVNTIDIYRNYFALHIKGDPLTELKMAEVEEEDVLEFITRLSVQRLKDNRPVAGTRTFVGVISFVAMTFNNYLRQNRRWFNPFAGIDHPSYHGKARDALPEEEVIKLFAPGVLRDTMELAVCAAMFLSGLRRGEIFALRPEDLDWHTPKINVRRAWQTFEKKNRVLGPPKGKKTRVAPFDPILQEAIKKLWAENGKHDFIFSWKDGSTPGPSWIKGRFKKWLARAGINLNGRTIVPHSARHSLASILEERGVSIRYIQELLGHSDLETTKIYLHTPAKVIRDIGNKISEAMKDEKPEQRIVDFKAS